MGWLAASDPEFDRTNDIKAHTPWVGWAFKCDVQGVYTVCSAEVQTFLDLAPVEFVDQTVADYLVINPKTKAQINKAIEELHHFLEIDIEYVSFNQKRVFGRLSLEPQFSEAHTLESWIGVVEVERIVPAEEEETGILIPDDDLQKADMGRIGNAKLQAVSRPHYPALRRGLPSLSNLTLSNWIEVGFVFLAILVGMGVSLSVHDPRSILPLMLGIGALVALFVTIQRPQIGLIAMMAIIYINLSHILIKFHGAPSIFKAYLAFMLVSILLRWLIYREKFEGSSLAVVMLGSYTLMMALSLLYASDYSRSALAFEEMIKNIVIALIIVLLLKRQDTFRNIIWALLLVGFILGSLGIYQYVTGTYNNNYGGLAQSTYSQISGEVNDNRLEGPIGDPNYYAQILVVLVPFAVERIKNEGKRALKIFSAATLAVVIFSIFLTFSRGGLIALLVVGVAFVFYYRPRLPHLLLGFLILAVFLNLAPDTFRDRLATFRFLLPGSGQQLVEESSYRGRSSEIQAGVMMFLDHPLLGVGVENYPLYYQQYARQLGIETRTTERSAHNLYVQIAAETGLVGFTISALLFYIMLVGLRRTFVYFKQLGQAVSADMVAALMMSILGYMSAAMFVHNSYPRYFWLLVGLGLAVPNLIKQLPKMVTEKLALNKAAV